MDSWKLRAFAILQLALLACGNDGGGYSAPRLLDQCLKTECSTTGTTTQGKGLTDDSIAFRIQPGECSIHIPFDLPSHDEIEILVAGEGGLSVGSYKDGGVGVYGSRFPLSQDGIWIPVSDVRPMRLKYDGGESAWLLDIRVREYDTGCM